MQDPSDRIIDIHAPFYTLLTSPTRYFESRRGHLGWFRVILLVAIGEAILAYIEAPYTILLPEYAALFAHKTVVQIATLKAQEHLAAPVGAFYNVGISLLITTVFLWLLARAFSVRVSFRNVLTVVAHASVVALVGAALATLASVITGHAVTDFLSLGMFARAGSRAQSVFGAVSVFNLWMLWVEIAGLAAIAGLTLRRAAGPVVICWLLLLLMSAGL